MNISKEQRILWDQQHVWHPFTQMSVYRSQDNLLIESAEGVDLIDQNGKRYIDGVSSLWVNVHGHNHPKLNQAIQEQLNKVAHTTLLGVSHTTAIDLAQKLTTLTEGHLNRVFYSDNGSTGVEVAIKIAYQYQHQKHTHNLKKKIVHLSDSYHGDTLGAVSVGGIDLFHQVYGELTFPTIQVECPSSYEKEVDIQTEQRLEEAMIQMIEKNHQQIAAFIVEPLVQGASGMRMYSIRFLKKIRELCDCFDIVMIADEVATGFYRTGDLFACKKAQVVPDILVLAKGITAGYLPLAATLTKSSIADQFEGSHEEMKTFFHGHSYTGNPLACAVSLANLSLMEEESFQKKVEQIPIYLEKKLAELSQIHSVGLIRQLGFMIGINIVDSQGNLYDWKKRIGEKICLRARKYGLLIRPLGSVLVLMPPLVISKEKINQMFTALKKAIDEET